MLKIQKVPNVEGGNPLPTPLPPLGRLTPSDDGASRRHIFYSYENTDFWAKILIFRCKNTEKWKIKLGSCAKEPF